MTLHSAGSAAVTGRENGIAHATSLRETTACVRPYRWVLPAACAASVVIVLTTAISIGNTVTADPKIIVPGAGGSSGIPTLQGDEIPTTPGVCVTWTRADAADTRLVECAESHLFEQAGTVELTDQTEMPDDVRWRRLVNERCETVVRDYLGGRFDPDGRYRMGALKPSPAKWTDGDRQLRCGLQSASRSGALYPITGRVSEQDQSAVYDAGTCLGIDGRTVGDPIDCDVTHAIEVVGVVI